MYNGEVSIEERDLVQLLATAKAMVMLFIWRKNGSKLKNKSLKVKISLVDVQGSV